jgi:Tfp pilus assembly protein PilO
MLIQAPVPPVPPIPPTPPELGRVIIGDAPPFWVTLPPQFTIAIVVSAIVVAGLVLWPLLRALARRIEAGTRPDPSLHAELEQLRTRVAMLEGQQVHLAELEERLDFAERLLTQQRAQSQGLAAGDQR